MSDLNNNLEGKKEIKASDLKAMIDNRAKYEDIAKHYGISKAQATRVVKEAGLKMRKFKTSPYTLVKDLPETSEGAATETTTEVENAKAPESTAKEEANTVTDSAVTETATQTEDAVADTTTVDNAEATAETTETATEEVASTEENATTTEESAENPATDAGEFASAPSSEQEDW